MNITTATVRVMKSYDYSHFEVTLGATFGDEGFEAKKVITDELRKTAARLADKAVEQYKRKKAALEIGLSYSYKNLCEEAAKISAMPEQDRSEEHKAILKQVGDLRHQARYDYQDDFPEDGDE